MMKKLLLMLVCMSMCGVLSAAAEELILGQPLTVEEMTELSAIMEKPEEFLGERVLVEGIVINVCPSRGCWIDIIGTDSPEKIKIKVLDGEIVFPMEIKGRNVLIEGIVYKIVYDKDGNLLYDTSDLAQQEKQHAEGEGHEEKEGHEEERSGHETEDGNVVVYQIRGLGAVVK